MNEMTRCLLGIGSNLGDRSAQMDLAVQRLREHADVELIAVSDWMETAPVGGPIKQQTYLNGAILVETQLPPQSLLTQLLQIERSLGRERDARWGPRSVDLDLLLYGDRQVDEPGLTVPHPWMAIRKFVLAPAEKVAPEMVHPTIGWTLKQLNENLSARPLVVAVVGATSAAQIKAVHAAAVDASAQICQLSDLLNAAGLPLSLEEELRKQSADLSVVTSVVSETGKAIELARSDAPAIVFDYWWRPQDSATVTPNLIVQLSTDESVGKHGGPTLRLPGDDLQRLQHDLAAAMECMQ